MMENKNNCFCYQCRSAGVRGHFGVCNVTGVTVNPYDSCPFGKKRDAADKVEPPVVMAALVRISPDGAISTQKYCTVDDAMYVMGLEEGKPKNAGCTYLIVDFTNEINAAFTLASAKKEVLA